MTVDRAAAPPAPASSAGARPTLRQTLAFARHLRPRQVARRLVLFGKHRIMARFGLHLDRPTGPVPPLAARLPPPLFPPRRGQLEPTVDGYRFVLLNQPRVLSTSFDWTLPELPANQLLWKMHLHYMEYLEEADDDIFAALVAHWITHNPPARPGYWHGIWHSYSLAIRIVVWLQQLAERRARLPAPLLEQMRVSLWHQAGFLHRNLETDVGGNHLIKNLKALLWAAAAFDHPRAAAWRRTALTHLAREIETQILPDGVHFERSPSYHCQVFADLLECHAAMPPGPGRDHLARTLERMARATADLAHPDGTPALFNDAGLHMAYAPGACLTVHARLLRPHPGSDSSSGPPPARHVCLADAGYYGLRAGGTFFLADCGPLGPDHLIAHGHGDILSFEWSVHGRRLVVDPGVFEYRAGSRRSAARSTTSHNTLTVGTGEQAEFFGAFRAGRRARARCLAVATDDAELLLEGTHDGFAGLPGHPHPVRRFRVSPTRIEIDDRVDGGAGQPVHARLLIHPDWRIEPQPGGAVLTVPHGPRVRLETDGILSVEPAVWWPDLGHERATHRVLVGYGPAPTSGRLVLRAD